MAEITKRLAKTKAKMEAALAKAEKEKRAKLNMFV